ncbi:SMI1/KNR4 family protein [Pseudomonas sp. NBRC 111127]|uniref:SMI1/KNR4 family protein n=1 Tax=Pseudomonas sp. NBRC 111127 TaxID=1661042 RepID=UPI0009E75B63|nr:SMI1/KNR4 family protein [Pseudomonas sp. NBRC 111127]
MAINKLTALMPSPQSPVDSGMGRKWPEIEQGLPFPSDYIDFINFYGSGRIADFILIFNPFSNNGHINFFDQFKFVLGDLKELMESDPDYYKYLIYPASGGLIPVGVTDNGDYIFWTVDSIEDSGSWGTAIVASRSPDVECFQSDLTTTLAGILSGGVKPSSFPDSFPSGIIKFDVF